MIFLATKAKLTKGIFSVKFFPQDGLLFPWVDISLDNQKSLG